MHGAVDQRIGCLRHFTDAGVPCQSSEEGWGAEAAGLLQSSRVRGVPGKIQLPSSAIGSPQLRRDQNRPLKRSQKNAMDDTTEPTCVARSSFTCSRGVEAS